MKGQLYCHYKYLFRRFFFFFQAEDGIRDIGVTGDQTCALPIWWCDPVSAAATTPLTGSHHLNPGTPAAAIGSGHLIIREAAPEPTRRARPAGPAARRWAG